MSSLSSRLPASWVALCLAACLATSCADRTAILIEVTSTDLTIPNDIDSLTIAVRTNFDVMFEETYPVSTTWPHSLAIVPPPLEAAGGVRIDVTGNLRGVPVTRRVASTEWAPGTTRRVTVVLNRVCLGVLCPDGYDCVNGTCCIGLECDGGDAGTDGGMRDAGTDTGEDDGGEPEMDAPIAIDAPMDAPMSVDTGVDAGRDAGTDGGSDAGRDAGTDAPIAPGARFVLNEIDYDQPSTDTAEYVEIYNAGSAAGSLDGLAVSFINGATGAEYARATLSGTLAAGAYAVVGVTVSGTPQVLSLPGGVPRFDITGTATGGMQNGAPDGVSLIVISPMSVLDSLAYEGSMPAAGEGSPIATDDSDSTARSLCRMPNGADSGNNAADFASCTPSPGASN